MVIPRFDGVSPEPADHHFRTRGRWPLLATTLLALTVTIGWWSLADSSRSGRPATWPERATNPVSAVAARTGHALTSSAPAGTRGASALAIPHACTAQERSVDASWPSAADLAGALGARPPWITRDVVAETVTGNGTTPVARAQQDTAPCTDGYFDSWSQTWFNLRAKPISAVSGCLMTARRSA